MRQYVRTGEYPRLSSRSAGVRMGRGDDLSEPDLLAGRRPFARAPLGPLEQPRADSLVSPLRVDVDVDVVVPDEGRVGDERAVLLDDNGVQLDVEPGHVPVREKIVELEVGRAELVDVARNDQVCDSLSLVGPGGSHRFHARN